MSEVRGPLGELDELGGRTARQLRGRDALRAALAGWERGTPWAVAVGLVAVVRAATTNSIDAVPGSSDVLAAIALTLAGPAVFAAWSWSVALRRALAAREGLRVLDAELHAADRLQTAHEFLGLPSRSPFELAAIEDARAALERAKSHELEPDRGMQPRTRAWLAPVAGLLLCVFAWIVPRLPSETELARGDANASEQQDTSRDRSERARAPTDESASEFALRESPAPNRESGSASQPEERTAQREAEREAKESGGKTGEGRSAQATPTSSSSNSRGLTSMQPQPSNSGDPGKPQKKKPKPLKKEDEQAAEKKKLEEQSGSTAGTGVGSGSSKNPGTSDWQSKDQVSTDEEDPLKEDDEVDDDSDESEARGGLQPSLRDRRPAVNRDLQIGFGNQLNPDANGRGGPSERKKSRGVASLVLGVPIPDHVKGQPNPGRTKITQERVQPKPDQAQPIEASARAPRVDPIQSRSEPRMGPWMREFVRNYFLNVRRKSESKS